MKGGAAGLEPYRIAWFGGGCKVRANFIINSGKSHRLSNWQWGQLRSDTQPHSGTPPRTPRDKYSSKKPSHLRKINNKSVVILRATWQRVASGSRCSGNLQSCKTRLGSSGSPVILSRKGRPPGVQVEESGSGNGAGDRTENSRTTYYCRGPEDRGRGADRQTALQPARDSGAKGTGGWCCLPAEFPLWIQLCSGPTNVSGTHHTVISCIASFYN